MPKRKQFKFHKFYKRQTTTESHKICGLSAFDLSGSPSPPHSLKPKLPQPHLFADASIFFVFCLLLFLRVCLLIGSFVLRF